MDTAGSGAGPGREPTAHTRALTHGHVGGGAQDPCTRLHVGSTYTQTRASPMAAGPTPARWAPSRNHTHRGAGLVWSHPCPHRPPLPGSLALEAPETPPAPGGVHTLPTRVPSWKNPEKARLSLGALRAPPPWDQEHSSLQGPELAADTPGVPTAPGRTGMRAGGGVQPRKLPPQASAPLPPPSPQPRTAGSQVQEPSLRGREGLPRRVRACLGRESGRVSSMCPYARPARPRPAHLWVGQLHWHQRLEVVGFPPQTTPQAARPRGSGSHPAPWQSGQQVPSREHPALESRGSSSPSRLRVWH